MLTACAWRDCPAGPMSVVAGLRTLLGGWLGVGQVLGEAGPGLWVRVKRVLLPNGEEMPLHEDPVYFLRWELVTTARLYDALPADVRRIG